MAPFVVGRDGRMRRSGAESEGAFDQADLFSDVALPAICPLWIMCIAS
jgi:hypothetical protein